MTQARSVTGSPNFFGSDTTDVTISKPLLAAYHRTLEAFVGGLKSYAGQRGMNYLLASTEDRGELDRFGAQIGHARLLGIASNGTDATEDRTSDRENARLLRQIEQRDRKRRQRVVRNVVGGLTGFSLVMGALAVYAFVQRGIAQDQTEIAETEREAADRTYQKAIKTYEQIAREAAVEAN